MSLGLSYLNIIFIPFHELSWTDLRPLERALNVVCSCPILKQIYIYICVCACVCVLVPLVMNKQSLDKGGHIPEHVGIL